MLQKIKDHLAKTVINRDKLNECFMNHFDKFIIRLSCQFTFNAMLYLRFCLESLKRQFCTSNVLAHLFFCNRSPNSNEGNCRSYSQLFVNDDNNFVSSIKYPTSFPAHLFAIRGRRKRGTGTLQTRD